MYTYTGDYIQSGDTICFLYNTQTGSSTKRRCKYIGQIVDFVKNGVIVKIEQAEHEGIFKDTAVGKEVVVRKTDDIICRINRKRQARENKILDTEGYLSQEEYDLYEGI